LLKVIWELRKVNGQRNCSETLITNVAETTMDTAGRLIVGAGDIAFALGKTHFVNQNEEFAFKPGGVVHLEGAVGVFDQAMGGAFAIGIVDE
jgi:hypothetical protein